MLSPLRYVISINNRSKLTIFTIAIVIMFVTSTLIIVYSFEISNKALVDRFESKYYIVESDSNLLDSRVSVSIHNATEIWLASAKINNQSTYIFAVVDPMHLLGYGFQPELNHIIPGKELNIKDHANVTFLGLSMNMSVDKSKSLKFFPEYWAVVNRTYFKEQNPNFLIVTHKVSAQGYSVLPMTALTQFYEKTAEDVTFDLMLIDMITIVVIYLFINALLSAEIRDSVKKIAIMRAIGSTKKNIGGIYLLRALYIGSVGMVIGFALGVILSYFLAAVIPLSGMLTYFTISVPHIVFIVDILISTVGSFFAALIPVSRAIKIKIVPGMKGVYR
uniref:Probable ABC transporter n=1 Tax=uncultured euryarchaeote Alv-FOS1 TaxID=337892 RepID=Q3SAD7_9EURY|nr:probable ABC transporter [uncultured euryarchaeote Alv-FOS1]